MQHCASSTPRPRCAAGWNRSAVWTYGASISRHAAMLSVRVHIQYAVASYNVDGWIHPADMCSTVSSRVDEVQSMSRTANASARFSNVGTWLLQPVCTWCGKEGGTSRGHNAVLLEGFCAPQHLVGGTEQDFNFCTNKAAIELQSVGQGENSQPHENNLSAFPALYEKKETVKSPDSHVSTRRSARRKASHCTHVQRTHACRWQEQKTPGGCKELPTTYQTQARASIELVDFRFLFYFFLWACCTSSTLNAATCHGIKQFDLRCRLFPTDICPKSNFYTYIENSNPQKWLKDIWQL